MSATTTMTIRVPVELKDRLSRLAGDTRRSSSFLAAEAVARYVAREQEIVDGIKRGMEDARAGRTVSHEDAMAEIRAVIDEVARSKENKRRAAA